MGIRRRRKKLTTILTSVDRRLRTVESRAVPTRIKPATITSTEIAPGVIPSTDPKDGGGTGSTASVTAPTEFAIVTAATYSPQNITGSDDWMEITTSQDHGLSTGDKVTVYGLNNNLVNATGTYVVTEVLSSTKFRYKLGLTGYYSAVVNLNVSVSVSQKSATTTVGTLVLSTADHGFAVGEVITVAGVDTDFDGTFFIASVNGATITYKFLNTLAASVPITAATGTVDAVVHKYAIIGDTWIDTSVTPNSYKVWDGLTWASGSSLPDGVVIDDGMAPKPPTGLSATQNGYYDSSSGSALIAVNLNWNAPTENADGSTLRDLAGYKVYYRYDAGVVDAGAAGSGAIDTTTTNSDGTVTGNFTWGPNDYNSGTTVTFTTTAGTIQPSSKAIAGGSSGTLQWTISGLTDSQQATLNWATPSSGYGDMTVTAGSTTEVSKNRYPATNWRYDIFGNTAITEATAPTSVDPVSGGASNAAIDWIDGPDTDQTNCVINSLNTDSTIIFAVKAYDSSKKNYSVLSDELTVVTGKPAIVVNPPSKPTCETRLGTLTVLWDGLDNTGSTMPPSLDYVEVYVDTTSGFTPGSGNLKGKVFAAAGVDRLIVDGLTYNTNYYAKLIAVSITGVKTTASVASDVIKITPLVDADLLAAQLNAPLTNWPFANAVITPGALAANTINATNLFGPNVVTQNAIAANAIGANQIIAGEIVAGKLAANAVAAANIQALAITSDKIDANAITTDKINAGAITAAKIASNTITANNIASDYIYAGTINAAQINAGTLTGFTVQTANTSTRVVMSGTNLKFYNQYGYVGDLAGSTQFGGAELAMHNDAGTAVVYVDHTTANLYTADCSIGAGTGGGSVLLAAGSYFNIIGGVLRAYGGITSTSSISAASFSATGNISSSGTVYGAVSASTLSASSTSTFSSSIYYSGVPTSSTIGTPIHIRTSGANTNLLFEYTSSREYKTNIDNLDIDFEKFMSIPIKKFNYKSDEAEFGAGAQKVYGYIAEDLYDAGFKDLVVYKETEDGRFIPHSLAFYSISAITQAIVNNHNIEINSLKNSILELVTRIEALEGK